MVEAVAGNGQDDVLVGEDLVQGPGVRDPSSYGTNVTPQPRATPATRSRSTASHSTTVPRFPWTSASLGPSTTSVF